MLNKTGARTNPCGTQLDASSPTLYMANYHYPLFMACQPVFSPCDSAYIQDHVNLSLEQGFVRH